jgi:hypothetical protein
LELPATAKPHCPLRDPETLPGRIAQDGAVVFAEQPTATNYDLVDEIATRLITTGGRVFGVRKAEIPRAAALAAMMRYPV